MVEHNIRIAADILPQVEFSPEIGIDTEPQFLLQVVRVAIKNGATILNIPDTRGGAMPDFIRKVFTFLHW
jgi:2-isopropylmalate synthase